MGAETRLMGHATQAFVRIVATVVVAYAIATAIRFSLVERDDLVRAGKVLYIGNSNFTGWQIADARRGGWQVDRLQALQAAIAKGDFPGVTSVVIAHQGKLVYERYFDEAGPEARRNTRSATIIGAVGAGGIGLKLIEAMRTNQDWENVAYMVLLILIVVFLFDAISNSLRSRLMVQL